MCGSILPPVADSPWKMSHTVDKSDASKNSLVKAGIQTSENGCPHDRMPLSPPPHSCLTSYRPALLCSAPCGEEDGRSLTSQDSGIPTLELSPQEAVQVSSVEVVSRGPSGDDPATLTLEPTILPSSSERRRNAAGVLNRSDDISVCSVSSLSTEISTTLSLSNDDGADFVVTSDSSAVVTFESDFTSGGSRFSDILLPHPSNLLRDHRSPRRQPVATSTTQEVQIKRSPILSFLSRSLFSKGGKDHESRQGHSESGWKIFGRGPQRALSARDPRLVPKENERVARAGECSSPRQNVRRNLQFEPLSTTALILEHRPANLPAKSAEEAERHQLQYEEMVVQAKRRELKDAQKRRKQFEDRVKLEESIGTAAHTWTQEILPHWNTMRSSRRVRDLWWQGVPPSVRGRVWGLAIGNDLNITHELFSICLARAKEKWSSSLAPPTALSTADPGSPRGDREASLELIKLDISRTFPSLCIFQQGGPYHDVLHSVLGAYTCYRPDVGYVQGMSFIAAVLILNMDTEDSFIAFANLLNKPCQMAFYRVDHSLMLTYFAAFEVFFEENLPKLFAHFKSNGLTPDIYLIDWIFTLYSKSLPLDLACRVWDVFCRDGEEFLFRTALGILRLYEDVLTHMDFIHMAQFLTRLPEVLPADDLFSCITTVNMTCRNKKWSQVLQALMKDPERSSPVLKR